MKVSLTAFAVFVLAVTAFVSVIGTLGRQAQINDLEAQVEALVELQELQATTHGSLLTTIENHQTAIDSLNQTLVDVAWIIEVYRDDHVASMFELYNHHIIELRAFHLSPEYYPEAFPEDNGQ